VIKKLAGDRVGLIMIGVTLVVILLIAMLSTMDAYKNRIEVVKKDGTSLARILSNMPLEQLIQNSGDNGVLQLLARNGHVSDFAYAVVVNLFDQPLASVTANSEIIPDIHIGNTPQLWISEHELEQAQNSYIEYRAPILSNNELAGYARLGYEQPKLQFQLSDVSLYAQMALPVFLLVPIFYFMFRRETRPLRQASSEMQSFLNSRNMQFEATTDNSDIINRLHQFITTVGQRMDEIKDQQSEAQESTLLLGYQRKRIEAVLQSIPDAVVVMDENGATTYANTKLEAVLGISSEGIKGLLPHEWCSNTQVSNLLAKYHTNIKSLRRAESMEFTPETRPGKIVSVSAYPLFTPTGTNTILGTLVVFHDKTNESLSAQAQNDFINNVSHELKSPLNVIQMYAETLVDDIDGDKNSRVESLNIIMDEVERLTMLISNLLNISKIESGNITLNKQRVKLDEFVKDTFDTVVRAGKDSQINFNLKMPRTLGAVHVDKELMRIALNNLLTNAIKYNDVNGHVTLEIDDNDDEYLIKVIDDGVGIATKDLSQVFEKFYRADSETIRQRSGHGLGLSLSKNIIDMHHGMLAVESVVGQGTTFTIAFNKQAVFHSETGQ